MKLKITWANGDTDTVTMPAKIPVSNLHDWENWNLIFTRGAVHDFFLGFHMAHARSVEVIED